MNGSILIPEKFKLNGKVINVIIDNEYCNDGELNSYDAPIFGESDFDDKIIRLASTQHDRKISKKDKEVTYFHELVHMILDSMGKDKLKYDEDFVESFSEKLYEYEKTKQ
jgi:hypothetical protein